MAIRLEITRTAKGYRPTARWHRYDFESRNFDTFAEAQTFLKERYGKAKRSPIYVDTKDGGAKQVGYVYGFRDSDGAGYKYIAQDWIAFVDQGYYDFEKGK